MARCWTVVLIETGKGGDADPALQATLQMSWMLEHNSRRQRAASAGLTTCPSRTSSPRARYSARRWYPAIPAQEAASFSRNTAACLAQEIARKPRRIAFSNGCAVP